MNRSALTERMHLVLDRAATPAETAELERALAADPAARAEFDRLSALFAGLAGIPSAHPPEGLVASVMAAVPDRVPGDASGTGADQLFEESSVIGETSDTILPLRRGRSGSVEPVVQPRFYFRGESMNGQQKRKMWIGGGVAAVAAVLLVSFGMNVPPRSSDTAGTIAPAQRYRADQNTSDNVNAAQAGGQTMQVVPRGQPALAAQAESNAVNNATTNATARAVDSATAHAVDSATAHAVDSATAHAVDSATARAVDSATARAVDSATARAVDSATAHAVDSATARAVNNSTAHAVDSATARAVDNSTAHAVDSATARAVNNSTAHAVDSATARAVNNSTAHAVDSATAKAVDSATAHAVDSATAKAVNNATIR